MNLYQQSGSGINQTTLPTTKATTSSSSPSAASPTPPPIVYGELSILGHNGQIQSSEKTGRRNKSKFLLCKRAQPNGIKKSRHYIVKQPQEIQEKNLHSIAYTFSKSQTIVVEYKQDEHTDMFQIGRSSEEPIDFVVMDTQMNLNTLSNSSSNSKQYSSSSGHHHSHPNHNQHQQRHHYQQHLNYYNPSSIHNNHHNHNHHHHHQQQQHQHQHQHHSENASSSNHQQAPMIRAEMLNNAANNMYHRHMAKVGEEMLHYGYSGGRMDNGPAVLINYPPPGANPSNIPAMMSANPFRYQESSSSIFHHHQTVMGLPSGSQQPILSSLGSSQLINGNNGSRDHGGSSRHHRSSHTTQSTISRFACRILVERRPPYTARIYAAGFDSSKNIFLGEKATKWEQNNSIDGLTTNGILIMKPKRGYFFEGLKRDKQATTNDDENQCVIGNDAHMKSALKSNGDCPKRKERTSSNVDSSSEESNTNNDFNLSDISEFNDGNDRKSGNHNNRETKPMSSTPIKEHKRNDSNNNDQLGGDNNGLFEYGGVWREVSVDGGIFAIRESRSAIQKGKRIENETNILQDGTLVDLCGATLLWRSLEGFRASPTKKSLEEKIDLLNTSRPQCPVGLNTLVIPKKPILPTNQHNQRKSGHHHHHYHHNQYRVDDKNVQPYIYPCGHVQGGHNWGATDSTNLRTCPICMSSGNVTKLSVGLEPSFYIDSGPLTHAFTQCGHMASEKTIQYWSTTLIPHGTHFFHSICPFCATPLPTNEPRFTKLIFQEDLD